MRPDEPTWTVLHISDTQFGAYHRFGRAEDSLASRLVLDVTERLAGNIPKIDFVVLSGDISERAVPAEYRNALAFVDALAGPLELDRSDFLCVPGNHDVSWKACESYFNQRESVGLAPKPPFAPKWKNYRAFRRSLTASNGSPVIHRPDLDVSIVLVDSTIAETHEEHFGWCGEEQLRSLASELSQHRLGTCVAVVHHNVRRKAEQDNENMRDEDDFTRILGPYLDLVLHGHTHQGKRDYLNDGTLVLATGSAAVAMEYRPDEAANQYQVISLDQGVIRRWGRRYEPGDKRFVADGRIGEEDRPGYEEIPLQENSKTSPRQTR